MRRKSQGKVLQKGGTKVPNKSMFEALRKGEAVEWEPGVYARVNPETRKLQTSSGKNLEIPDNFRAELFPDEKSLPMIESREKVQSSIASSPFGEFGHQFGTQGIPGAAKDWINFFTQSGEDYIAQKSAEQHESSLISENSPWTSAAATGANIGLDLALTRGMSGVTAVPGLIAAQAGPRILEEPGQVATEALTGAAAGWGVDKAANFISKTAARRAASRQVAQETPLVREINERGAQRTAAENAQSKADYSLLKSEINNKNIQSVNQHKQDLSKWKGDILSADAKHTKDLKDFEAYQKKVKKDYSDEVVRQAERIGNRFPQGSKVISDSFGSSNWIEQEIARTGLIASPEGKKAAGIIKNIFPEGEFMTPQQIVKGYRSLENQVLTSEPEVSNLLLKWKEHLSQTMPKVLGEIKAFKTLVPKIEKDILDSVDKILVKMKDFKHPTLVPANESKALIENSIKSYFRLMDHQGVLEKVQSGKILDDILSGFMLQPGDFSIYKTNKIKNPGKLNSKILNFDTMSAEANRFYRTFMQELKESVQPKFSDYSIKASEILYDAEKGLGAAPRKTLGAGPDIPPLASPSYPPQPNAPTPLQPPAPPMPNSYQPIPEPTLSPAGNFSEKLGDRFEQPLLKGSMTDNLTKLAFLKMLGGPATHAAEGAAAGGYMGLKALTNPNIPGAAMTQKGGLAAIDAMGQKYYSYHNGILDDPAERRSFVREIEDDPELTLEDKAILQSKINRGKSVFSPTV